MSATTSTPPAVQTVRDRIISDAKNADALLAAAQVEDPDLYNLLVGKATNAAATQAGGVVMGLVSLAVTHYGLGMSEKSETIIAGLITFGAGYVIHWIQARVNSLKANPAKLA
jgi:hypothetical protein